VNASSFSRISDALYRCAFGPDLALLISKDDQF
jgi:hypothetical protein